MFMLITLSVNIEDIAKSKNAKSGFFCVEPLPFVSGWKWKTEGCGKEDETWKMKIGTWKIKNVKCKRKNTTIVK